MHLSCIVNTTPSNFWVHKWSRDGGSVGRPVLGMKHDVELKATSPAVPEATNRKDGEPVNRTVFCLRHRG